MHLKELNHLSQNMNFHLIIYL